VTSVNRKYGAGFPEQKAWTSVFEARGFCLRLLSCGDGQWRVHCIAGDRAVCALADLSRTQATPGVVRR
jgi:hypothetical protein